MENEIEPQFTIPESAYEPIRNLVQMDQKDFDALISGLTSAKPSISTPALSRHIAAACPKIPSAVISSIVSQVMTMEYLKQDSEMEAEEFAVAVAASAFCSASEDFEFTESDANILEVRLTKIFQSDHILELNTKAIAVVTDHDNLYLSAKILTDARPVFNDDGSALEAIAVVHMLRIHFENNSSHKDFFTAMDVADLRKLKQVIERAERKAEVLKNTFKAANIPYLDIEPSNVDAR